MIKRWDHRLIKAAGKLSEYSTFESVVTRALKWYNVPPQWTKRELIAFYYARRAQSLTGGRV